MVNSDQLPEDALPSDLEQALLSSREALASRVKENLNIEAGLAAVLDGSSTTGVPVSGRDRPETEPDRLESEAAKFGRIERHPLKMRMSASREQLEAIMLVGGKGTRLRPLTMTVPKPLLPTAGVPFLAHQLSRMAECGITHVVVATSYRADTFTDAFGTGEQFGLSIDYVYESEPLGTGGGIRNAARLLRGGPDDPIVILNGDILSGHDLPAQVDLHRKKEAAVTLHLVPVDDPSRYGCVRTDDSGRVTAFFEKTPHPVTNQINAGCYVFRRSVIDQIPAGQVVSVERETFPGLIQDRAVVMGYAEDAYWLDVGTLEAFVRGSCDVVLGALFSSALDYSPGECLVLGEASVADGARLSGGTTVGRGAVIESSAVVSGSVIFDGAVIGAGAIVRDSVVGKGAVIAGGAAVHGVVVGDEAYVGPGNELARGLRVFPGKRLEATSVRFSSDS